MGTGASALPVTRSPLAPLDPLTSIRRWTSAPRCHKLLMSSSYPLNIHQQKGSSASIRALSIRIWACLRQGAAGYSMRAD